MVKPDHYYTSINGDGPDLRGPAIVIRGGILEGHTFHGPFETIEDAVAWCHTGTLAGIMGINNDTVALLRAANMDGALE